MRIAGIVLATAVAIAVQTTLARFVIRGTVAVDQGKALVGRGFGKYLPRAKRSTI